MDRAKRGDARAFGLLYERHRVAVLSAVRVICRNPQTAEDVTHEAFVSAWRQRGTYDPARATVLAWLLGVGRMWALDALRQEFARPRTTSDESQTAASPSAGVEHQAIHNETTRRMESALQTLPAEQRQVIDLAYYSGLNQHEIASVLSLPLETVKGRLRLAMNNLRAALAE